MYNLAVGLYCYNVGKHCVWCMVSVHKILKDKQRHCCRESNPICMWPLLLPSSMHISARDRHYWSIATYRDALMASSSSINLPPLIAIKIAGFIHLALLKAIFWSLQAKRAPKQILDIPQDTLDPNICSCISPNVWEFESWSHKKYRSFSYRSVGPLKCSQYAWNIGQQWPLMNKELIMAICLC